MSILSVNTIIPFSNENIEITSGSLQGNLIGTASTSSYSTYAVTSSYSVTASYAENAGGGSGFPFTGSADITGSLNIAGNILPTTGSTYDLGSDSLRWNVIYTSDLSLRNDLGDWTIVEGEDDLFLYNNKKSKVYKFNLTEVQPSDAPPKKE